MVSPMKPMNAFARYLLDEWQATDQPLAGPNPNVIPLGDYADGSVHMAWPEFLGVPSFKRMYDRGPVWDASSPEGQAHALDALGVGGSLALGGIGASAATNTPRNALMSNGVRIEGQHPNYTILKGDVPAGRTYVREYDDTIQLGQLNIDPAFQRQGVGTEAQRLLAEHYGKPTVPDMMLSPSEYARWAKNDPAAVADYAPFMGGYGPSQGTEGFAAAYGGKPTSGTRAAAGELFSNPKEAAAVQAGVSLANDSPKGITAYHGSPHDFDRFSLEHIGKGEGAQSFGHGLYFAENEGVARSYREALADPNVRYVGGVEYDPANPQHRAASRIEFHGDAERAKRTLQDEITYLRSVGSESSVIEPRLQELEILESGNVPGIDRNHGRMYQVRINAEPEQFLDWDKPLSGQSEAVRKAIAGAPQDAVGADAYRYVSERPNSRPPTGDPLVDLPGIPITDHGAAARKLREAGIPGIKYLDQGSRGAGEGSSNYVVFDDALIEILKKYSNPPTASIPALATGQGDDDQFLDALLARYGVN